MTRVLVTVASRTGSPGEITEVIGPRVAAVAILDGGLERRQPGDARDCGEISALAGHTADALLARQTPRPPSGGAR
ncbi:hypothetical protein [Actinophytocola gossypii]|uniref:Uncharacterized protein n=1 Tax=Actinophytocola gossypii TaxID=2812003 RepID=A0ABT2JJ70_9PSEU|nr:hypothetical protein [Actinophytocola gossypii]MCT2587933.1 hypothetical protein [Actinophytocola gossypii]